MYVYSKLVILQLILFCQIDGRRIFFPDETPEVKLSSSSDAPPTSVVKEVSAPDVERNFSSTSVVKEASTPDVERNFSQTSVVEEVSAPNVKRDFSCGYTYPLGVFSAVLSNGTMAPIYYLNKTAKKLSSEGFIISDQNVLGDVLNEFTVSNESFSDKLAFNYHQAVAPVGGKPASRIRAFYMAQIGEKNENKITWLCDGVLINRQWILTAAHCFTFPGLNPNLVRLGDYNLTEPVEQGFNIRGKYIEDYSIEDVVPYPEFKFQQRYHDIILLKLPQKTPQYSISISPICLPWGNQTNLNLVGSEVVLTGWGATRYGGQKTEVLQEVDLKVFNTSRCNEVYKELPDHGTKYPSGMTDENILCVGWEEGEKDACKGDSGAPIVYQEGGENNRRFVLAGIVSGGYGCGLKKYPGIYIPVNKPKYLKWIKEVAFQEYN